MRDKAEIGAMFDLIGVAHKDNEDDDALEVMLNVLAWVIDSGTSDENVIKYIPTWSRP